MKLTPKQEKFSQLYVKLGNASEAYRQSYNCGKMKTESIHRKAKELLDNVKISARIGQLSTQLAKNHDIDKDFILNEYMQLLLSCKEEGMDGQGTLKDRTNWAKALAQLTKMLGLDAPDKQEILHKGITININKPKKGE
jgi:phage terminase small subunit